MRTGCANWAFLLSTIAMAAAWSGCCRSSMPAAKSPNPAAPGAASAAEPPQTAEGCRACNGEFAVHGLAQTPTCNCRTGDMGKRCRGKEDCEGECIGDQGDREVTSPGPPVMGHRVGRCAEFRTSFGCHVFLPPRGPSPAPVALDETPEQICVD
jgi:hypothetical protein